MAFLSSWSTGGRPPTLDPIDGGPAFTARAGPRIFPPSLKVKRNVVEQRYAEQVALLYPVLDVPSFELDDLTDAELSEELATS